MINGTFSVLLLEGNQNFLSPHGPETPVFFLVCLGCRKSGAVGSRLTGAGWGGCAVSMVPTEKVDSFLKAVRESYFLPDPRRAAIENRSLFVSKPGGGAAIFIED